ncbi:bifunctional metallophosphatase/5'-nucleotidase [Rummeliibacillus suwonensis]|uniref:bifunctional metallophosphatase/5'-nucleotidase n=1 Tax=Rummeliibacillus suwonensis TaxID=1306154 RepID=UPI001FD51734|nr:5'-nucleotidase C-terminal domain-containing protein [Rummeliibacillus suwonensis]
MYNLKRVNPLASLILGSAVIFGTISTTQLEVDAASRYKISHNKLVQKSNGKVVKGFKLFKGKLYKNGKLYKGLKGNVYYKNGKKGTGKYKGIYYSNGKPYTGIVKQTGKYYKNGKPYTGIVEKTGKLYVKGKVNHGLVLYKGNLYNGPKLNKGLTLYKGKLYKDSKLNKGVVQYKGLWYSGATLANGLITTSDGKKIRVVNGKEQDFELSIMHTNDTHAHLDNIAKRATAIQNVRFEKPNSLLLDAGDVFSGTLYFNEFKGRADLKFMNALGYDAMTFGNHEFDLGSSPEGHQALADFIKGANFPFVSANVDFSADDRFKGLFTDLISSEPEKGKIYNGIIKEIDGEKVGIFGLTTAETKDISSPGSIAFENYIEEAQKAVKAFEGQDVDKIIALTHIGYDDNPVVDNDRMLAASVKGIDVIVGGHSHTQLDQPVIIDKDNHNKAKDSTVIVQAYQYSDFLGTVDVEFDSDGKIVKSDGKLIKINDLPEDPQVATMLKDYSDKVKEISNQSIGAIAESELPNPRTDAEGNGVSVRNSETALGDIVTDGMLAKAKTYDPNIVLALQNGGGIRSAIPAGDITVGEVITVLPFGNTLATMTLTGAELKSAFEISFKEYPKENGGFLHVSGGKVEFDSSKPVGERVVSISYKDESGHYQPIQDQQTYKIATNAFTAKGGDGYTVFAKAYEEGRVTDLGLSDWENLAEHLTKLKTVAPVTEGRIVDVKK